MRRLIFVLVLILASCATLPSEPVRVPAEIMNSRIHIPVSVNGGPPVKFILDTGAGGSPLAKEYADTIGVKGERTGNAVGAGGSVPVSMASDIRFRIGEMDHRSKRSALIPFGQVSLRVGHPIDGIIGHDVLARWITEIDYAGGQVSFHAPATWRPPADAIAVPVEFHHGLPIIRTRITVADGRTLDARLLVDTGAGAAVVLKKHYVDQNNIDTSKFFETAAGMGVGGATRGRIGRIARLEFGGITVENPVTNFSLSTAGALGETSSDGLLGGEILRRFRFITDYPHNRLYFVPTAALRTPYEWDMSGLLLQARDASYAAIEVVSVVPDSPAARAGLRAGDEVRAIDGQAVKPSELSAIREGFKQAGKTYTLTIRRDGAEQNVTIVTRRLS